MSEFKIGDKVKAIKDIVDYGVLGEIGVVERINACTGGAAVRFNIPITDSALYMCASELELITTSHPTIIIHTDGKTTTALLKKGKKVVNQAETKLIGNDEYAYWDGANRAYAKLIKESNTDPSPMLRDLMGVISAMLGIPKKIKATPPEAEWVPKVGDRVEVVESVDYSPIGSKGTICIFTNDGWSDIGVVMDEKTRDHLSCNGYCKKGYGNWFDRKQLKLISPVPKQPRIVKQGRYEVGDKVMVKHANDRYNGIMDIIRVEKRYEQIAYRFKADNGETFWYNNEIEGKVISDD